MRGALPGEVVCKVLTRCPSTFDLASMASRRDATLPHAIAIAQVLQRQGVSHPFGRYHRCEVRFRV